MANEVLKLLGTLHFEASSALLQKRLQRLLWRSNIFPSSSSGDLAEPADTFGCQGAGVPIYVSWRRLNVPKYHEKPMPGVSLCVDDAVVESDPAVPDVAELGDCAVLVVEGARIVFVLANSFVEGASALCQQFISLGSATSLKER